MNIQQLAIEQPFTEVSPLTEYREAVVKQAQRHTRRRVGAAAVDIIQSQRPNESEAIQEYRAKNERQFTRSGTEKFISKAGRIITHGLTFTNQNKRLTDWLATNPFYDTGNQYDFEGYLFGVVFPLAVENPNQLAIAFPYNPLRPDIAPAKSVVDGGLADSESLGILPRIVTPDYVDDECFAYVGGTRMVSRSQGPPHPKNFYYAADANYWYTLEPSYQRGENGAEYLIYTPEVWYRWDLGHSPVNLLPGSVAATEWGKYRESFLRAYFAFADEAINAFSDNQAIRVRFAHPTVGVSEVTCYNDSCNKGTIYTDGKPLMSDGKPVKCGVCHGSGIVAAPGPFGQLVRPKAGINTEEVKGPLMEFYTPEIGILQNSYETWKDLFKLAKQEIGLDLLDGTGVESGVAKDLRMEDLHDLLSQIGMSIGTCGEQWLRQFEALLNPIQSDREYPTAVLPASYKLLEAHELKDNAEAALFEDRFEARMELYAHKYRGRPELIRLYEIALSYAPSMLLNEDELANRLLAGSLVAADIVKRDYAVSALKQLDRDAKIDLTKIDEEAAFGMIDAYLQRRGLIPQPNSLIGAEV